MADIPDNDNPRDFDAEVDKAVNAVLTDPEFQTKNGYSRRLCMNHARANEDNGDVWIHDDVAREVARMFKAKGYFVHYNRSIYGIAYRLTVTKYHTNQDE